MAEQRYVAEHVTTANPWDVFALLTDEDQQSQWRARFEPAAPVAEASPYTRVRFEDGLVVELEPEGTGTRLIGTRQAGGNVLTRLFAGRRAREAELADQLSRIAGTLEYGDL